MARGAAVLALGGLAAGCSSGASGLTDGLVTNSTSTRSATVAQADQRYPGDRKIVRPQVPVGSGVMQSNAPAALPAPSSVSAPVYTAPAVSQSAVSSAPLPPAQSTQAQRSAPAPTPAAVQRSYEPQPAPVAAAPAQQLPQPAQKPVQNVAVLPQAPKPQDKSRPDNASAANASSSAGSYTVVAGDTLYGISRKTGADVESIRQANGLASGAIQIGQRLTIPSGNAPAGTAVASAAPAKPEQPKSPDPISTGAAVAARETSSQEPEAPKVTAYTPPVEDEGIAAKAESATEVAALTPDSTGVGRLRWPARGRVVSAFGAGSGSRSNDGIDIAVPEGTSVRAAENGVVIYSGDGLKGFGNTVLLRHEDGLVTVYGHASDIKVKRGESVKRGQEIALSGMSGDADRPKLHFEVRKGTNPVDPMIYLE